MPDNIKDWCQEKENLQKSVNLMYDEMDTLWKALEFVDENLVS